jgi:hypothetical protein
MINTQIRQLRDSIVAMTNASPLPIEVKRLVFAEIQTHIEAEAENIILAEKENAAKESEVKNNE